MSNWGVGIFDSDVAQEVRESYVSGLQKGRTESDVITEIIATCSDYLQDPDDACDFWLALASVAFDYGNLTDEIKAKSFEMIEYDLSSERWEGDQLIQRQKKLDEFKNKLSSEQHPKKTIRKTKPYIPKIKPNEILEFELDDDLYCGKYYHKGYIYVLVDRWETYDARIAGLGDQFPLVFFKYSAERITEISQIDKVKWMLSSTQMNEDETIAEAIERRLHDDNKVLMMNYGFNKFKKKLSSLGEYDFERPSCVRPVCARYTDDWELFLAGRLIPSLEKWEIYYN